MERNLSAVSLANGATKEEMIKSLYDVIESGHSKDCAKAEISSAECTCGHAEAVEALEALEAE